MNEPLLGQGTFGKVEKVGREARKTIVKMPEDEGFSCWALREADAHVRFKSPFLTRVSRITIEHDQIQLWMPLAQCSLASWLEQDPKPDFRKRLDMAEKVLWAGLNALLYLHSFNVLHRDIKPDNMLLLGNGNAVLSDLGSCRIFSRGHQLTGGIGTLCFRPPEMENAQYGKTSDIFGLGVSVLCILHGNHPVEGFNPRTLVAQWYKTLETYRKSIPLNLFLLLQKMIRSEPKNRILARQALEHPFFGDRTVPSLPKIEMCPWPQKAHPERKAWICYVVDLGNAYHFHVWTLCHAVHLFDDYWIRDPHVDMHLLALVSIWVAGKVFEELSMPLTDLFEYARQEYPEKAFVDFEKTLVSSLGFRMYRRHPPHALVVTSPISFCKQILSFPGYVSGRLDTRKTGRTVSNVFSKTR